MGVNLFQYKTSFLLKKAKFSFIFVYLHPDIASRVAHVAHQPARGASFVEEPISKKYRWQRW